MLSPIEHRALLAIQAALNKAIDFDSRPGLAGTIVRLRGDRLIINPIKQHPLIIRAAADSLECYEAHQHLGQDFHQTPLFAVELVESSDGKWGARLTDLDVEALDGPPTAIMQTIDPALGNILQEAAAITARRALQRAEGLKLLQSVAKDLAQYTPIASVNTELEGDSIICWGPDEHELGNDIFMITLVYDWDYDQYRLNCDWLNVDRALSDLIHDLQNMDQILQGCLTDYLADIQEEAREVMFDIQEQWGINL